MFNYDPDDENLSYNSEGSGATPVPGVDYDIEDDE